MKEKGNRKIVIVKNKSNTKDNCVAKFVKNHM